MATERIVALAKQIKENTQQFMSLNEGFIYCVGAGPFKTRYEYIESLTAGRIKKIVGNVEQLMMTQDFEILQKDFETMLE